MPKPLLYTSCCIVWLLVSLASLHLVSIRMPQVLFFPGHHKFYFCFSALLMGAMPDCCFVSCFYTNNFDAILSSKIPFKCQSTPASWHEGNNQPVRCCRAIICPCQTCWLLFLFVFLFANNFEANPDQVAHSKEPQSHQLLVGNLHQLPDTS